jgi:uncharacterized hydrophobic protein (TIGR00271 family)
LIELEAYGASASMTTVAEVLDEADGVSHVRLVEAARAGHSVVVAGLRPRVVDAMFAELRRLGVSDSAVTLTRVEVVGRAASTRAETSLVWEDVLGTAWLNARPIARYIAFMIAAGVVGCYGVVDSNTILIVGAMAISPDLLPITAIGVGVTGRRPELAGRGLLTLALGLGIASAAAAALALGQDLLDLIPSDFTFQSASAALGGLTEVDDETIVVALAAGVAGMLALETRASAGVGVAVSVTTIPAAAYLGVAAGLGELDKAFGALGVLGMNVAMMVVGASATLALQRRFRARATARHELKAGARSSDRGDDAGP